MKKIRVKLTLIEEMLGMMPNSQEVYGDYIASRSPDAATVSEEVASVGVDEVVNNGTTVFPRTDKGEPFMYDYQIRGYFKETAGFMNRNEKGKQSEKGADSKKKNPKILTAHKKAIDGSLFVEPRKIVMNMSGAMGYCERPLRGQTAQGERIALARSETIPAGSTCEFTVVCMDESLETFVYDWLEYGKYHGTGQWRNSGKGKFLYEILDENGNVIRGNKE